MVKEDILSCYNLIHKKRGGRPPLYSRDSGTPELRAKREQSLSLQDLNYQGTLAGCLLKKGHLTLEEVEIFQKIHLMRRRYLSLQHLSETCSSNLAHVGLPRTDSAYFKSINENPLFEKQWRMVAEYVTCQDKRILKCIDKLFTMHAYDSLQPVLERFIKEWGVSDLRDFAYYCWSAWKAVKRTR